MTKRILRIVLGAALVAGLAALLPQPVRGCAPTGVADCSCGEGTFSTCAYSNTIDAGQAGPYCHLYVDVYMTWTWTCRMDCFTIPTAPGQSTTICTGVHPYVSSAHAYCGSQPRCR